MRTHIAVTACLLMLGITVGCARSAAPTRTTAEAVAASDRTAVADVGDIVCSPAGTRVTATQLIAQRDGVHLRVQNTSGASGVYLNYRYGQPMNLGGGEPVDSASVLVLELPPGPVQLNCAYDQGRRQDAAVAIVVLDPERSWQTGALARLGCSSPERSLVDWVYGPGIGATADAALATLTAQLEEPVTWVHVQDGYVEAARQTYVLLRAGKPWATASVTRSSSGSYDASLGSLCT
jgi:hypothetical protein